MADHQGSLVSDPRAAIQYTDVTGTYAVAKSDDVEQNIFGWASVAITKSGEEVLDHHADLIDPADLAAAAYTFVIEANGSGEDHNGAPTDGILVESMVFTKDKLAAMGLPEDSLPLAWWVGFHIPDRAAYETAKASKSAFSIEGTAYREEIA